MRVLPRLLFLATLVATRAFAVDCPTPVLQWDLISGHFFRAIPANVNGDSRDDLVTAYTSDVSVRLANNGTFASSVVYSTDYSNLQDIAVGEFTSDAHADIAVALWSQKQIALLSGNGDGTFTAGPTLTLDVVPNRLEAADWDEDGNRDLLVTSNDYVIFLRGNGSGGFTEGWRASAQFPAKVIAADFDADGNLDFLVREASVSVNVWYGDGAGSFAKGAALDSTTNATDMAVVDLNGDNLPDVIASRTDIKLTFNTGSRTFAAAVTLAVPCSVTLIARLATGDVTGDGKLDLVASLDSTGKVATWNGNGDGTFGAAACHGTFGYANALALTDLTGDARKEIVVNGNAGISVSRDVCGQTSLIPGVIPFEKPVAGDTVALWCEVARVAAAGTPVVTGTVTFKEGNTVLGTGTLSGSNAQTSVQTTIAAPGLHTYTLLYSGDGSYDTNETTFELNVAAQQSTLTIDMPAQSKYQQGFSVKVLVDGAVISQSNRPEVSIDGGSWQSVYADGYYSAPSNLDIGPHTVQARYAGSPTIPRGSATASHTITKATPQISVTPPFSPQEYATTVNWGVNVGMIGSHHPTGTVSLLRDGVVVATKAVNSGSLSLTNIPPGTYQFHVTYSGDDYLTSGETSPVALTVVHSGPPLLTASYRAGHVTFTTLPTTGTVTMHFYRQPIGGSGQTEVPASGDDITSGGYLYWYTVHTANGTTLGTSAKEPIIAMDFTDEDLAGGSVVKAAHFNDLLAATNVFRNAVGLTPTTLETLTPGVTIIRGSHLTALRDALNQARLVAGVSPVAFTDMPLGTSRPIRLLHILELRAALH